MRSGAASSAADAVLCAHLQAAAWQGEDDEDDSYLEPWELCHRLVSEHKGARAETLTRPLSRSPALELPVAADVSTAESRLLWTLSDYGLCARSVRGDGACQFRAVADQFFGDQDRHAEVRAAAVEQLRRQRWFYADFAEAEDFDDYLNRMALPSTWGDHLSLQAIADVYGTEVCILTSYLSRKFLKIEPSASAAAEAETEGLGRGARIRMRGVRSVRSVRSRSRARGGARSASAAATQASASAYASASAWTQIWLGFFAEYHYVSLAPTSA